MALHQPTNDTHPAGSEKIAFTIDEACTAVGLGKTSLYEAISEGKLKSFKACGRRLILKSDLMAFLDSCRDTP
jgi:excisionase family DNA binding protein